MKTAKEINQIIKISDYLKSKGIYPSREYQGYLMYHSPFREEKSPSMKVSETKNLWIDYGTNEGGTLIDLVLKIFPTMNVHEAINEINREMLTDSIFSFHQPKNVFPEKRKAFSTNENKGIQIDEIKDLGSNPSLTTYLKSRMISLKTAQGFCKEVYFTVGEKQFFGIGNQNEKGWAIRNKFWKGCSGQGISLYKKGHGQLAVFEGIFDLLSYLEIEGEKNLAQDFLVLNSLANLNKSSLIISLYNSTMLLLDNDESGKKATLDMVSSLKNCYDLSEWYSPFKDLNDYLLSNKIAGHKRSLRIK